MDATQGVIRQPPCVLHKTRHMLRLTPRNPEINIYPNPSNDNIYVNSPYEIREITLHDFNGKIIYSCSMNCNIINVAGIEKGIYIFKATTNKYTLIEKVVITK